MGPNHIRGAIQAVEATAQRNARARPAPHTHQPTKFELIINLKTVCLRGDVQCQILSPTPAELAALRVT
jgi:hypothetical protein